MELLSIVFACKKFRVFILDHRINVFTDHQALIFLCRCRLRNARLTRWTLLLQEYDLQIQHCLRKDDIMDVLSRNLAGRDKVSPDIMPDILKLKPTVSAKFLDDMINKFKDLQIQQLIDERLSKIFKGLEENNSLREFYTIYQGVLFFRRCVSSEQCLVCILVVHKLPIIILFHEMYGYVGA